MTIKELIAQLNLIEDKSKEVYVWANSNIFPFDLDELSDRLDLTASMPVCDPFPYALGYWQGRACGQFENGTYENMTDYDQHQFKLGYSAGVADYCEMDIEGDKE
jgi:hypothetical protein